MLFASVVPNYAYAKNITPLNELSVESSVLTEGITVDGNYIPAGTIAVTVNISNNTGFDNSRTVLELGEALDVIEGEDSKPLVTNGSVLDDSLVVSAEENNLLAVVSASVDTKEDDGALFTFYVNADENSNDRAIIVLDIPDEISNETNEISPCMTTIHYIVGDVNNDNIIDGRDATATLTAHSVYINDTYGSTTPPSSDPGLSVYVANALPTKYFGFANAVGWAADTDFDNYVNTDDAYDILDYYAKSSVSPTTYVGNVGQTAIRVI